MIFLDKKIVSLIVRMLTIRGSTVLFIHTKNLSGHVVEIRANSSAHMARNVAAIWTLVLFK